MKLLNVAIDSMTILVPMDAFVRYPIGLYDDYLVINSETSEIVEDSHRPVVHEKHGIKTRCSIYNLIGVSYVSITVNSKMLRFAYLDGICNHNFILIENYLQNTFNCLFSPDWMKRTIVIDCDFKGDFYMNSSDYTENLQVFRKAKGSKIYYAKKVDYISEKQIAGLQFVNRRDGSIRYPFVKFYDKLDEMLNRSSDFFEKFFVTMDDRIPFHDLKRVEVTVRNKDHFISLGVHDTTLYSILNLSNETKLSIIKSLVNRHFDEFGIHSQLPTDSTLVAKKLCMPKDYLIVEMMLILMKENNFTLKQCLSLLDTYPGLVDNTKSNIKRTLKKAFKDVSAYKNVLIKKITLKDAFL